MYFFATIYHVMSVENRLYNFRINFPLLLVLSKVHEHLHMVLQGQSTRFHINEYTC